MDWQQFISGLTIAGVPAIGAVIALVAWFKSMGLPDSWTGAAAGVIGIVVVALIQAIQIWPKLEPVAIVLVLGPILGLAANGAYSQVKHIVGAKKEDRQNNGSR